MAMASPTVPAVQEEIGHGLGHAKHWHQRAGDMLRLETSCQQHIGEAHDLDRQVGEARAPVLASVGNVALGRHLVGEPVEGQGRGQADRALGYRRATSANEC